MANGFTNILPTLAALRGAQPKRGGEALSELIGGAIEGFSKKAEAKQKREEDFLQQISLVTAKAKIEQKIKKQQFQSQIDAFKELIPGFDGQLGQQVRGQVAQPTDVGIAPGVTPGTQGEGEGIEGKIGGFGNLRTSGQVTSEEQPFVRQPTFSLSSSGLGVSISSVKNPLYISPGDRIQREKFELEKQEKQQSKERQSEFVKRSTRLFHLIH